METEKSKSEKVSDEKALSIWNGVLNAALKIPGAKVNRSDFLSKEFSKYNYSKEEIQNVIENGYNNSSIDKKIINKIASSSLKLHTTLAAGISFAAGLPGGWFMAGTIPADLAQFYYHVIVLAQKLAYIYGWPSFDDDEPSDEFLGLLTMFIGVMSGSKAAGEAIGKLANNFAIQFVKRIPQMPLTKYGFYQIAKQIAKWLGVSLTKQSFAKGLGKVIPVFGGVISGGLTLATFLPMANKLKKYLSLLPLAKDGKDYKIDEKYLVTDEETNE